MSCCPIELAFTEVPDSLKRYTYQKEVPVEPVRQQSVLLQEQLKEIEPSVCKDCGSYGGCKNYFHNQMRYENNPTNTEIMIIFLLIILIIICMFK